MKKGIFLALLALFLFGTCLVSTDAGAVYLGPKYDWSEKESPWVAKLKAGGALLSSQEDFTVDGVAAPNFSRDKFFTSTVTGEIELDYHWTDHISFSTSLGYYPGQSSTVHNNINDLETQGRITMLPLTAMMQYYFAPYGQFRPYVGAGAHYTYFLSTYDSIKPAPTTGAVVQAGFDWWIDKEWGLNFDVRKYWMDTSMNMTNFMATGNYIVNTVTVNPVVASIGVAYRF